MPINAKLLQQRLAQVGVIRLGEQRVSKAGKPYPAKLETFRITSPDPDLIARVAELYGGTPTAWPEGPGGKQWQVTTRAAELPVHVLPQKIDPNFELWGPNVRLRLCDGETERIRDCPCICDAERQQVEAAGRAWVRDGRKHCKPTTRLSLMISDVPSLGSWKVESHGWNAAAELPTLAMALLSRVREPVPAILRLELREDRKLTVTADGEKIEPRSYMVPVLDFGQLATPRQALGSGIDSVVHNALGAAPERLAISSGGETTEQKPQRQREREQPAAPATDWRAEIAAAKTPAALNRLKDRMQSEGVADQELVEAWMARKAQMEEKAAARPAQQSQPTPARAADTPSAAVVDAEVEPDTEAMWTKILAAGKGRGWNLPAIEERYRSHMGHDPSDEDVVDGFKFAAFLAAVENGQVQ